MAKKKGRPPVDLHAKILGIPAHTEPLSPEAESPIRHYRKAVETNFVLINYINDHMGTGSHYPAIKAKHMGHLRRLVLGNVIETFERFIKELAAVCIDQLSPFVVDDRYNTFTAKGNEIIAHFEAGSIGKALCESDTWLNNETINARFRRLLAPSGDEPWDESLLPARSHGKAMTDEARERRARAGTLALLWQIRHTLAHNSGVLTGSDSMKLKVLSRRPVESGRTLAPTEEDLRYVKRFLTATADDINQRVGKQLAVLLTAVHVESPSLINPEAKARQLANIFDIPTKVATAHAEPIVTA